MEKASLSTARSRNSFDTELLEVSRARGTGWAHATPLQSRERARGRGAKLEIEAEMGADKNKSSDQNTGQEGQRQKQSRSRMETGLGQLRAQGGHRGHTEWGQGSEKRRSEHRAELGEG